MNDRQLRSAVDKRLSRPVDDHAWALASEYGYVAEALDGAMDVAALARQVRHAVALLSGPGTPVEPVVPKSERRTIGQTRDRAVSDLIAVHARTRPDVQTFRAANLRGDLLRLEDVEAWVLGQLPDDRPAGVNRWPLLAYGTSGWRTIARTRVPPNTDAGHLAPITQDLHRTFLWTEDQATAFVLTDSIPVVPAIRGTYTARGPLSVLSRITMTIDPMATPREVMEAYSHQRQRAIGVGRKPKSLSKKHLALAVFAAERADDDWPELLRAWNKAAKDLAARNSESTEKWTYRTAGLGNFKRDALTARDRLLHPYEGSK